MAPAHIVSSACSYYSALRFDCNPLAHSLGQECGESLLPLVLAQRERQQADYADRGVLPPTRIRGAHPLVVGHGAAGGVVQVALIAPPPLLANDRGQ
jgi:hypothetical protein